MVLAYWIAAILTYIEDVSRYQGWFNRFVRDDRAMIQGKIFRESLWKKSGAVGGDWTARCCLVQYIQ
ncbi:hypothetical protein GCM10007924_15560 [Sneathiella chinensis]|uniref:Uncharacterized protein n=1 Tax=Sneathiella chinensis TaxID=349750 RepID=A0ABQ5U3T8_9PROT|nr:hypothetical protein GCM10007924_15560 [Sneathiella chinensis]